MSTGIRTRTYRPRLPESLRRAFLSGSAFCGRIGGRRAETAGGNGLSDRISYHKGLRFIGQLLDNEGQLQRGLPSPADRFEP